MNWNGLAIGIIAFAVIGGFHPIIVWCEYRFTERVWPAFLVIGIAALAASCYEGQAVASPSLAIFGCTCLWSIRELKEQTKRVQKGWFPRNPRRESGSADGIDGRKSRNPAQ